MDACATVQAQNTGGASATQCYPVYSDFLLVYFDGSPEPLDSPEHRKKPIGVLNDVVGRLSGPVLIAGDFNTPVDSSFFDLLRPNRVFHVNYDLKSDCFSNMQTRPASLNSQ